MSSKPPPVPPRNRAAKGPQPPRSTPGDDSTPAPKRGRRNLKQQGRQGNIKQNTTNQGYQQDR